MRTRTLLQILIFFCMALVAVLIVKGIISEKPDYIAGGFLFGFLSLSALGMCYAECGD